MRKLTLLTILLSIGIVASAYDWDGISVPANAGSGNSWQLQTNVSDDFNYTMDASSRPSAFTSKWVPSYHNAWTGPGATLWNADQVWSNGTQLAIQARPAPGGKSYNGIITSKNYIKYPIYMEIKAKIMNQVLANAFWTLNDGDTQEIDIMEGYGASTAGIDGSDQSWYANRMHISHHTFIRSPFTDYQPMDAGSWHYSSTPWRGDYHRYGCYWKDPWTLEYYIDGVKVRTVSGASMIDPNNHLGGTGLHDQTKIIIDCENQTDWRPAATEAELSDDSKNIFWVDWVRFYKPIAGGSSSSGGSSSGGSSSGGSSSGGSSSSSGGTDLAVGKSSFQSSTYQNNTNSFGAGKVVDNNGSTFNHTNNETGAWWEVDLGTSTNVTSVKIWNRGDCCQNRLQNFDIKLYNSRGGTQTKSVYVSGQPSANGTTYNINGTGRVVRVQLRGSNFLHIDQVSVYGTPGGSSSGGSSSGGSSSGGSSSGGTYYTVPGKVEAENYSAMNGIQTQNTSDAGGGKNVGWVGTGDWMDYQVNVQNAGTYNVEFRVASASQNIKLDLKKGNTVLTSVNSSTTNGWQNWKTVTKSVNLSAGQQTLRVLATGPSWNFNYMNFVASGSSSSSSSGGSSSSSSGCSGTTINVEAESFTNTGGTFNDGTVPLGANKNGNSINWVNNGDWMDYTVNVPSAGSYNVSYRISSPITGSNIKITAGSSSITTTVPNNGQWDSYQTLNASGTLNLNAGNQTIRVQAGAQTWTWNLDKFTLSCAAKEAQVSIAANLSEMKIYPNPANDVLNIELPFELDNDAQVIIYNNVGRAIAIDQISDSYNQISLSDLTAGMYILQVVYNDEVVTKRFAKN